MPRDWARKGPRGGEVVRSFGLAGLTFL